MQRRKGKDKEAVVCTAAFPLRLCVTLRLRVLAVQLTLKQEITINTGIRLLKPTLLLSHLRFTS